MAGSAGSCSDCAKTSARLGARLASRYDDIMPTEPPRAEQVSNARRAHRETGAAETSCTQ